MLHQAQSCPHPHPWNLWLCQPARQKTLQNWLSLKVLRWVDGPELYGWAQSNHMMLKNGKEGGKVWLRDVMLKRLDLLLLILSLENGNLEPRRARKLGTARKQRPPDYNNRVVEPANNHSEQEKACSPGAPRKERSLPATLTSPSEIGIRLWPPEL